MGAMKNAKFRKSVHSKEHVALRVLWIEQRKKLGLSQRELAKKLGVTYSLIGKIETGDRRLDIFETIDYCDILELNPHDVIDHIKAE